MVLDSLRADVHGDGGAAAGQRLAAVGAEPVRGDVRDPVVTGEYRLGDVRHISASSKLLVSETGWRATVLLPDGVRGLAFS